MKHITTGICLILCIVLTLFGVVYGAKNGWQGELAKLNDALNAESGLNDVLSLCAADAANMRVVAARHLNQGDGMLTQLADAHSLLSAASTPLTDKHALLEQLKSLSVQVESALKETASYQASSRDQSYWTMLTTDLAALAASDTAQAYNKLAQDYNTRKSRSLSGWLAGLLGTGAAPVFE